jgi:hypothetical protein
MAKSEKVVEAILQASDNRTVADFLVRRAADPVDPDWLSLWGGISKEGEFALLERGDRLIDLRLAEFCRYSVTARALFHRDPADTVLRALVLSNRTQFLRLPEDLFPDVPEEQWQYTGHPSYDIESFLQRITSEEGQALFENPAISESFLSYFLMHGRYPPASRVMYWQALPPKMRGQALRALSRNPLLQRLEQRGFPESNHGQIHAAWGLLGLLDVTVPNAYALAELCEQLAHNCDDDLATALQRWTPEDDEERERELKDNRGGDLSNYQRIRRAASAALLRSRKMSEKDLLQSDDLALRCGAYMGGGFVVDRPFTPEQMRQGIRRDGWFAVQSMLRNPSCWKTTEARELILSTEEELTLILSDGEEDGDTFHPRLEYWESASRDRERTDWLEKFQKEHPEWFKAETKQTDDNDAVDTTADADGATVDTPEVERSVFVAALVADIRKTLANLGRWQVIQFVLLIGALVALFFR